MIMLIISLGFIYFYPCPMFMIMMISLGFFFNPAHFYDYDD